MKTLFPIAIILIVNIALLTPQAQAQEISGNLFTVDHIGDTDDALPGDSFCADSLGNCTLRAAIQEANIYSNNDVIVFSLPHGSEINLTKGELEINSWISIVGPGARRLTVKRSQSQGVNTFRVFHIRQSATIRGLRISNGDAGNELQGGGILVESGRTLDLLDSVVSNNRAIVGGGIANLGNLNLTRVLISSNAANSQGGAIMNVGNQPKVVIVNSTITSNSAFTGGALVNNGAVVMVNATISHNLATSSITCVSNSPGGVISVMNTIIGNNTLTSPLRSVSGAFVSLGNNIVSDARGSTGFINGVNRDQVSDNNLIDPLLADLADNGGQLDSRALLSGSPAIDQANSCVRNRTCSDQVVSMIRLDSDQRIKYRRPQGNFFDIGAFEKDAASVTGNYSFGSCCAQGRFFNSLAILTNPTTNEKYYSLLNLYGFNFSNLVQGEVYVLERKFKRQGVFHPAVYEFSTYF